MDSIDTFRFAVYLRIYTVKKMTAKERAVFLRLFVRGMNEHFSVVYADYMVSVDEKHGLDEAYNELMLHTGGDNRISKREFYYERPQILMRAEYKGLMMHLIEYKRIQLQIDKKGKVRKVKMPNGIYLGVEMPTLKQGEVRCIAPKVSFPGGAFQAVDFEDIEFNKTFLTLADNKMAAFRIFTPAHLLRTKEAFRKVKENGQVEMHLRFTDGLFSAIGNKKKKISGFLASESASMDDIQKGIEDSVEFIKLYFDVMALDTEKYTMG